jgi:hypothetical protein
MSLGGRIQGRVQSGDGGDVQAEREWCETCWPGRKEPISLFVLHT